MAYASGPNLYPLKSIKIELYSAVSWSQAETAYIVDGSYTICLEFMNDSNLTAHISVVALNMDDNLLAKLIYI